jgi:ABC-type transport system involved in cytochrome bd biosynthesis fused ATPase/permease subunit
VGRDGNLELIVTPDSLHCASGVPSDMINVLVDRTIRDMDVSAAAGQRGVGRGELMRCGHCAQLTLKAEERTSSYSGGNKRKLSVALSMVASPTVNFLDEPSTGMDPETRRFMWDYIASVREGRALVSSMCQTAAFVTVAQVTSCTDYLTIFVAVLACNIDLDYA